MSGGNVDHARREVFTPFGLNDMWAAKLVQSGREGGCKSFWHVLHDQNGGAVRRNSQQEAFERLGAAG